MSRSPKPSSLKFPRAQNTFLYLSDCFLRMKAILAHCKNVKQNSNVQIRKQKPPRAKFPRDNQPQQSRIHPSRSLSKHVQTAYTCHAICLPTPLLTRSPPASWNSLPFRLLVLLLHIPITQPTFSSATPQPGPGTSLLSSLSPCTVNDQFLVDVSVSPTTA